MLPTEIGINFGGPGNFKSSESQIHYSNPARVQNVLDSSGVRFYYSTEPREIEMGVFSLGDSLGGLGGTSVCNGISAHSFNCPSSCSEIVLPEPGVTVLLEALHMYNTGMHMVNDQIRDGEVLRSGEKSTGIRAFRVLPGDSFNTVCYYQTDGDTDFGPSLQDKMCDAFIYYYPRQVVYNKFPWMRGYGLPYHQCTTDWTELTLTADDNMGRSFGNFTAECRLSGDAGTLTDPKTPGDSVAEPLFVDTSSGWVPGHPNLSIY